MNTTTIVRSLKDKNNPFTRLSNLIGNLKADEAGIMFQILSNSDKWVLNKDDVMKKSKLGRDRFDRAWDHLKDQGYIVINKIPMKGGKFGYSYTIYEIPGVQNRDKGIEKPDTDYHSLENGNTETGGTNNNYITTNIEITTTGVGVDPRNEVKGDTDQNEDLVLEPGEIIEIENVPTPSLRCGEGRDNQEDPKIKSPIEVFGSGKYMITSEFSCKNNSNSVLDDMEPEWTDDDIKNFQLVIDDLYNDKLPNWNTLLKTKPLYSFISETSKIHGGIPEIVEMITIIYNEEKKRL